MVMRTLVHLYIDNKVIFSNTWDTKVLEAIDNNGLTVILEKCTWGLVRLSFWVQSWEA